MTGVRCQGLNGVKSQIEGLKVDVGVAGRRGKVISGRRATDRNYKSTFHSFFSAPSCSPAFFLSFIYSPNVFCGAISFCTAKGCRVLGKGLKKELMSAKRWQRQRVSVSVSVAWAWQR